MQMVVRKAVPFPPIVVDLDDPSSWWSESADDGELDPSRVRSECRWSLPVIDQHGRNRQTTLFFELWEIYKFEDRNKYIKFPPKKSFH